MLPCALVRRRWRRTGRAASVFWCVSPNRRVAIRNTTQSDKSVSGMGHGGCLGYFSSWLTDAGAGFVLYLEDQTHPSLPKSARRRCVRVSNSPYKWQNLSLSHPLLLISFHSLFSLLMSLSFSYCCGCAFLWERRKKSTFPSALWRILFTTHERVLLLLLWNLKRKLSHKLRDSRSFEMTNFREHQKKRCQDTANLSAREKCQLTSDQLPSKYFHLLMGCFQNKVTKHLQNLFEWLHVVLVKRKALNLDHTIINCGFYRMRYGYSASKY